MRLYRYRLASVGSLCRDIENSSERLKSSMETIGMLVLRAISTFDEIKEILPELKKMHVKVAELEEYKPEFQNTLYEQKERYSEKESTIFLDLGRAFREMEESITALRHIVMDADTIIYKESRMLDKFISDIEHLKDMKVSRQVMKKIITLKEDLLSVALRLMRTAKAEERDIFPKDGKKPERKPLSERISSAGIEVAEIGRLLDHLDIDDIDEIVKDSEKQLEDLEKIETSASMAIRDLENHLAGIKNKLYLLQGDSEPKIRSRLISVEKRFDKLKSEITKNAESLVKDLKVYKKID